MKFAPEYVTYVLNENFEDAKELFLSPLIAIHYAHLVMLASQRIVSPDDAHALRVALDTLSQDEVRRTKYDPACEDLFYYVERLIVAASGENVAGRLHTARSRNDIDMTMYRMRLREFILGLLAASFELRRALPDIVDRLRAGQSQPARRVRDYRHRVSNRSSAHLGPARFLRADRQHLRQHRDRRLSAREYLGDVSAPGGARPLRPGFAAVGHVGVRLRAVR